MPRSKKIYYLKNESIKTNPELTQILELADKDSVAIMKKIKHMKRCSTSLDLREMQA